MSIILIEQKKSAHFPSRKLKSRSKETQDHAFNQNQTSSQLNIKALQAKFIQYLNELNSSIQNRRTKTLKKSHDSLLREENLQMQRCQTQFQKASQENIKSNKRNNRISKRKMFQNYKVIQGNYINGKLNGETVLELVNGSKFEGQVVDGQLKFGTINFPDGTIYKGGIKNMLFHGHGSLKLPNGSEYRAEFEDGIMHRKGQIIYENGDVYKGEIQKYKKHGYGQLKLVDGNKYEGNFLQGEIEGYGIYYIKSFPAAMGIWHKGEFMGKNFTSPDTTLQNPQNA